jgi:pSer/pThr/pTyr-binding forkhead associated (FHA) protein
VAHPIVQVRFKGRVLQSVPLDRKTLRIGRLRENDIVIDNLSVSRHHATLHVADDAIVIEDEGSENGCLVNGERVERAEVAVDDDIWIGKHQLTLRPAESSSAAELASRTDLPEPMLATPWDGEQTYCVALDEGPEAKPVPEEPAAEGHAGLIVQRAGRLDRIAALRTTPFLIGRSVDAELALPHAGVSRRHAQLLHETNGYEIEDLGSVNGTRVNGAAVQRRRLEVGDEIEIGEYQLTFVLESKPLEEEICLGVSGLAQAEPVDETSPAVRVDVPEPPGLVAAPGDPEPCEAAAACDEEPESGSVQVGAGEAVGVAALEIPIEPARGGRPEGHIALELEVHEADLPAPLLEALRYLDDDVLRLPVTLRIRR